MGKAKVSSLSILSYDEALELSPDVGKRHLLIGNGFSIACRPAIFVYKALFEQADFNSSPRLEKLFSSFSTHDFELIIKKLIDAEEVIPFYREKCEDLIDEISNDAEVLKEILVKTISSQHPDITASIKNEEYASCQHFLSHFACKFSLNYDLLLYWTVLHDNFYKKEGIHCDDGFRADDTYFEDRAIEQDYVVWESWNSPSIQYLNGALHLFLDSHEIKKYTWSRTNITLMEQIRSALESNKFPLFVADGDSNGKMAKIIQNAYLHKAYRSFSQRGNDLFLYGYSLSTNDNHILEAILKSKVKNLFIGLYGKSDSDSNKHLINQVTFLQEKRPKKKPLTLHYYDAETAKVWTRYTAADLAARDFDEHSN